MTHNRVLFLDDEAALPHLEWAEVLTRPLKRAGFVVHAEDNPARLPALLRDRWSAVLLDLKFGNNPEYGFTLLKQVRELAPGCPVVMLTGLSGVNVDLRCHAAGADAYVCKDTLDAKLLAEHLRLLIHQVPGGNLLVGVSPQARELRRAIELARSCDSTVLITGETGTGKELVARGVHLLGDRWHPGTQFGNFVAVNCAGVPETLWESEMFGHRKGAATGLTGTHCGAFLLAGGFALKGEPRSDAQPVPLGSGGRPGTLFLDEVGELPLPMQAKLLRAVQERRVRLVGDPREYPQGKRLDVRLVAATNRSLADEMAAGSFRADLYYRLHVLPVHVPPLRERREDIPVLLAAFLKTRSERDLVSEVADDVVPLLQRHSWPGNVRELENAVERSLVGLRFEGGGVLRARHFTLDVPSSLGADRLCCQVAEAILAGEIEPESIQPRPVEGVATFGTRVYRTTAHLLRSRGELSQKKLADVWHLKPGSIGPLNTVCDVQLRRRSDG